MNNRVEVHMTLDEAERLSATLATVDQYYSYHHTGREIDSDIIRTTKTRLDLAARSTKQHPVGQPSDVKVGDRVRLRWTGDGNVPQYMAHTWATVTGVGRARIKVSNGVMFDARVLPGEVEEVTP